MLKSSKSNCNWYRPLYGQAGPAERGDTMELLDTSVLALRKEKSRDAARNRRGKENYEFYELAKMLPLPAAITSQLDKASIIRLTISYLKMRDFSGQGDPPWNTIMDCPPPNKSVKGGISRRSPSAVAIEVFQQHLGSHLLQALDGFVFALTRDGRFLYISETVSIYLGLSQVEMTGSSVFDYVHPGDHAELAEQLGIKISPQGQQGQGAASEGEGSASTTPSSLPIPEHIETDVIGQTITPDYRWDKSCFIRMKSTLTKRGVHVKSSGYKVIHVTGRLRPRLSLSHSQRNPITILGLVAVAHALPPPTINEIRMEQNMFVSRVTMDLKIIYCEPRITDYMDLAPSDVVSKSCYDFLHAEDVEPFRRTHYDLINKGQVVSSYYRWILKNGGYIWVQTCATVTFNTKNNNEKSVIFINYVLSLPEYKDIPMDISQVPDLPQDPPDTSDSSDTSDSESDSNHDTEQEDSRSDSDKESESGNSETSEPENKKKRRSDANQSDSKQGANQRPNKRRRSVTSNKKADKNRPVGHLSERDASENNSETKSDAKLDVADAYSFRTEDSEENGATDPADVLSVSSVHTVDTDEDLQADKASLSSSTDKKHRKAAKKARRRSRPSVDSETEHSVQWVSSASSANDSITNKGAEKSRQTLLERAPPAFLSSPENDSGLRIKSEPREGSLDSDGWNNPPNRQASEAQSPPPPPPDNQARLLPSGMPLVSSNSSQVTIPDSVLTPPTTEGTSATATLSPAPLCLTSRSSGAGTTTETYTITPPLSVSPRESRYPMGASVFSREVFARQHMYPKESATEGLQRFLGTHQRLPVTSAVTAGAYQRMYSAEAMKAGFSDVPYASHANLHLPTSQPVNLLDSGGAHLGEGHYVLDNSAMEMLYRQVRHGFPPPGAYGNAMQPADLLPGVDPQTHHAAGAAAAMGMYQTPDGFIATAPFHLFGGTLPTQQQQQNKQQNDDQDGSPV
ncbi:neuronal PAS domain-containing protein 3-like isoform X2 [Branchiostoma floridae x Branchiostoma japonicum]